MAIFYFLPYFFAYNNADARGATVSLVTFDFHNQLAHSIEVLNTYRFFKN